MPHELLERKLEVNAQKHLGTVPENNSTSTPSVNSGSEPVNTGELDPDDSAMPELKIFHKRNLKRFLMLYKMTVGFKPCQEDVVYSFKLATGMGSCRSTSRNEVLKTAIYNMETKVAFGKDKEAVDVDVHLYKIHGLVSLMYLLPLGADIMFCWIVLVLVSGHSKTSHLNAVKRIFKYLKGKPNLGLWYPRESPFDLEAFSDSDYGGSNLDRKSTTGGCQFLGQRLI
ncbi:hypothetical protein Tco_0235770 [Tanacetum coccineum]